MTVYEQDETVLCTIECAPSARRFRGDRATLTDKRLYKTGLNKQGVAHRKTVNIHAVTAAEWSNERYVRYLVLGLAFLALCCLCSVYFLPGGKTLRLILGLVCLGLGAAVAIVCVVAYFRFTLKTVTVYYAGGKMRIAVPGISDEDADEFVGSVLKAAAKK